MDNFPELAGVLLRHEPQVSVKLNLLSLHGTGYQTFFRDRCEHRSINTFDEFPNCLDSFLMTFVQS
ncbi:hypothetical protein D3C81_2247680 [compost metagenome]